MAHGRFEVRAHSHRQLGQAVARGDVRQEREVQRGLFIHGRDAHQTLDCEAAVRADRVQKRVHIRRQDARLLGFFAGVDLDVEPRGAPFFGDGVRKRARELWPIHALDHIEERDRVSGFVGLQGADQAQLQIAMDGAARRPSRDSLLDPVLAKEALASRQRGVNAIVRLHFADRDQGDVHRIAARGARAGGDGVKGSLAVGGDVGRGHDGVI